MSTQKQSNQTNLPSISSTPSSSSSDTEEEAPPAQVLEGKGMLNHTRVRRRKIPLPGKPYRGRKRMDMARCGLPSLTRHNAEGTPAENPLEKQLAVAQRKADSLKEAVQERNEGKAEGTKIVKKDGTEKGEMEANRWEKV